MRLDIGCGESPVPGFEAWDRRQGREAYPLAVADGACEEIRASHVLEHFSHRQVSAVLADWFRALRPGGLLRIAVPDFEVLARAYLAGQQMPAPLEAYVMGGHVDSDDHHGALFDYESLRDLLLAAGFVGVTRWVSEQRDCASLPISLNLQAWKPPEKLPRIKAVMSMPRLGFADNFFTAFAALKPLGIELTKTTGAFWGQCLERVMEEIVDADSADWILTLDYDTVFHIHDLLAMISAVMRHPEIDALAPVQAGRKQGPLFTIAGPDGHGLGELPREHFDREVVPITTAHFGLTLIRVAALKDMPHPWYHAQPGKDGRWGDDRTDDDIYFWRRWLAESKTLYLASRVAVGHLELQVLWPDREMQTITQMPADYWKNGKPEQAWR